MSMGFLNTSLEHCCQKILLCNQGDLEVIWGCKTTELDVGLNMEGTEEDVEDTPGFLPMET
jgi:hypothetical protein